MNPDQTAPKEQSDLGPYCLHNRLTKNTSLREEQTTKVVIGGGGLRLIFLLFFFHRW